MVLCFTPFGAFPLAFVCLVPLLLANAEGGWCAAAAAGGAAGAVVHGLGYGAVLGALGHILGCTPVEALPLFGVFVVFHTVRWSLAALAWRACLRRSLRCGAALPVAAVWVSLEWAYPQILPWQLGAALGPAARLRQGADLFGVYGLSFLAVLINALLAQALRRGRQRGWRSAAPPVGWAAMSVLSMLCYGTAALAPDNREGTFVAALIQGGARASAGEPAAASVGAWADYAADTRQAGGDVDLIVWPESVLRIYVRENPGWRAHIAALARESRTALLLGALDRVRDGGRELNSAYLVAPVRGAGDGEERDALQIYHKRALVPFAETVPRWWPWRWRTTGDFVAGGVPRPLEVRLRGGTLRLAPSICYEAILPGWFNSLVRDGAEVLVNLTDDSWFDPGAGPAQHFEMARLRAVETRRWLLRASASGVSALIDPRGDVVASLPFATRGTIRRRVERVGALTAYVRYGDWVVAVSFALLALRVAVPAGYESDPSTLVQGRLGRLGRVAAGPLC